MRLLPLADGSLAITQKNGVADGVDTVSTNAGAVVTAKLMTVCFRSDGSQWDIFVDGVKHTLNVDSGTNSGDWFGDTGNDRFCLSAFLAAAP